MRGEALLRYRCKLRAAEKYVDLLYGTFVYGRNM